MLTTKERLLGASTLALRLLTLLPQKLRFEDGKRKSIDVFQSFVFDYYFQLLGLAPQRAEVLGISKIIKETANYWFWADSYFDDQPLSHQTKLEEVFHKGITDQQRFSQVEDAIYRSRLPQQAKRDIKSLILHYKERALDCHNDFVKDFDPFRTSYGPVLNYRQGTTGEMGEMIVSLVGIAIGADKEDLERYVNTARREVIGMQMIDDMGDCAVDFGRRPNLFDAALLENPQERQNFSEAVFNKRVLDSKRPYQIAESTAPQTLAKYLGRFRDITDQFPKSRRDFFWQWMAATTFLSFTPQREEIFSLPSLLSRKTQI